MDFASKFGYRNLQNPFEVKTKVPFQQTAVRSLLSVKWFISTDMTVDYSNYFSWLYPFLSLIAQGTKRNEIHAPSIFLLYN